MAHNEMDVFPIVIIGATLVKKRNRRPKKTFLTLNTTFRKISKVPSNTSKRGNVKNWGVFFDIQSCKNFTQVIANALANPSRQNVIDEIPDCSSNWDQGRDHSISPLSTCMKIIPTGHNTARSVCPSTVAKCEIPEFRITLFLMKLMNKHSLRYMGINVNRVATLAKISFKSNLPMFYCMLTLRKLRLNESFEQLSLIFALGVTEVERVFNICITKLALHMRPLVFRFTNASYIHRSCALRRNVSKMFLCVQTDMGLRKSSQYKFLLRILPNNIISYISNAYIDNIDTSTIIKVSNIRDIVNPETILDLNSDTVENKMIEIINGKLAGSPTMFKHEPMYKFLQQMQQVIRQMYEFRILKPNAIEDNMMSQYLDELLVVVAAAVNLNILQIP